MVCVLADILQGLRIDFIKSLGGTETHFGMIELQCIFLSIKLILMTFSLISISTTGKSQITSSKFHLENRRFFSVK